MAHNINRKSNMSRKSASELIAIVKSGSLSSACAAWHLWDRFQQVAAPTALAEMEAKRVAYVDWRKQQLAKRVGA